ncbi:MAG: hypothetical protein ACJ8FO_03235 [Sphingomicrobium sp.]
MSDSDNDNPLPFIDTIDDPEILSLLEFEPVVRKNRVAGAWTHELQREFIARLAVSGSVGVAAGEMGKDRTGAQKLFRTGTESFCASWRAAVELAERRKALEARPAPGRGRPPSLDSRRKHSPHPGPLAREGEEEESEWDDPRDSISQKLRNARRLFLAEISSCPGKRAAFEILTELPIDWDAARRFEPQVDEPWRPPNLRQGDMLLTAENGWMGDFAHGPDKKDQLRRDVDEHRARQGLEPVDWEGEQEE